MHIEEGQMIDRYHIIEQVGEGGMATVYKAFDTRLEREVALKIIRREVFSPAALERVLARFAREGKALARLSHNHIIKVFDYGEYEGSPYLVMEYVPAGTLKERLGTPIAWQEALKLVIPIAEALGYAHLAGVIHRDVKPSNILINQQGQPLLTDFGIAKLLEGEDGQTLTGTGVGVGTPEYMAPEQGIGAKSVDGRADQYALGVVLYELLTGRKPYTAETPMAVVVMHVHDPLPRPRQFVPGLPEDVEQILFKALAKKPEDRYADMEAFAGAMERLLTGNTQPASVDEPAVAALLETPVPVVEAAPTVETFEDVIEAEPVEEEPLTSETFEPAEPSAEEGATSETFEPVVPAAAPTMETFEPGMQAAPPSPPPHEERKEGSKLGLWILFSFVGLIILANMAGSMNQSPATNYQPASITATAQPRARHATGTAQARASYFGPQHGSLEHESYSRNVSSTGAGVNLKNFLVSVTFYNPTNSSIWDYGIYFRDVGWNHQYRFQIFSDGGWILSYVNDPEIWNNLRSGYATNFSNSENNSNQIEIRVVDDQAEIYINDILDATIDVSQFEMAGDIYLTTGNYYTSQDYTLRYEDWIIESLP